VVPHPVVESEDDIRRAEGRRAVLRGPLEAQGMRTLVGVFGDLNAAKLIDVVLASVAALDGSVHVVLVGRRIEGYDVEAVARAGGLGGRLTLLTDVSDEDFLGWLCAADVVVDLRYPHRGEVSGSLLRAMQCGRATVVSATGTYLDIPEGLVAHAPAGRLEPAELAAVLGGLAADVGVREEIGRRARAHVVELAEREATARAYADAIEGTLALVADPARRALARWSGALADIGVTEEHLGRGYGTSYARALEELRPGGPAEGG
jgi:glycosyltransferase involved in cell wall biosynthesis